MRETVVDTKGHGAEGRVCADLLLAGSNEERIIPGFLWWRGCRLRFRVACAGVELLGHPSGLVALSAAADTRSWSRAESRWAARRWWLRARRTIRGLAALRPLLLGSVELDVEIAMESLDSGRIGFHGARSKDMFGTTATEATTEIRGEIADRSARGRRGRVLIISLNSRTGRGLGRRIALHGSFSG